MTGRDTGATDTGATTGAMTRDTTGATAVQHQEEEQHPLHERGATTTGRVTDSSTGHWSNWSNNRQILTGATQEQLVPEQTLLL